MGTASQRTRQEYARRINAALELIERDLASEIPLSRLAAEANFSPFHFHRVFTTLVGETPADHVRRLRLEKAAVLLLIDPGCPVTSVALDCGFSTSALFCRLFKERFVLSPTAWRERHEHRKNRQSQSKKRKDFSLPNGSPGIMKRKRPVVRVQDVAAFRVAYVRHRTGYQDSAGIEAAFQELFAWAGPRGVLSPDVRVLGIPLDDPDITPKDKRRYYACVTVADRAQPEGKVGIMSIRPGKYAVGRFSGKAGVFRDAYAFLYGEWLPRSGWQPDDAPAFESYIGEPGGAREKHFVFELFVPVKPL